MNHIEVINLSPRESECCVCGRPLLDCKQGIPFYEGEPVPHNWTADWVGCDACVMCFAEYEALQSEVHQLEKWYLGARGRASVTVNDAPATPIDTEHRDCIICPHCGHKHDDSEDWGTDGGEYMSTGECARCDKPFSWRRNVTVTYTTSK